MNKNTTGFTIVELLIVIVVIAILAAISIVAYNGIQQRASNTATINAASQSMKLIQAYIAQEGTYPATTRACITVDSGCQGNPSNDNTVPAHAGFSANMAQIGTLPKSVPTSGTRLNGVFYAYEGVITVDGEPRPAALVYYLSGTNQNCGLSGVVDTSYPTYSLSTMGYSNGNDGGLGKTQCRVAITGP